MFGPEQRKNNSFTLLPQSAVRGYVQARSVPVLRRSSAVVAGAHRLGRKPHNSSPITKKSSECARTSLSKVSQRALLPWYSCWSIGASPGAAATLTLVCGFPSAPRRFQMLLNNTVIADVTEPGTSAMGADFRQFGFGVAAGTNMGVWPLQRQAMPARIDYFAAQDQ